MNASIVSFVIVAAHLALSALASAEEPHDATPVDATQARAVSLYEESVRAYQAGQFEEAARLVRAAHELAPKPVLIYNLARAYEKMGHAEEALENYKEYLREEANPPDKGAIEKTIVMLQKQVDEAELAKERQKQSQLDASHRRVGALVMAGVGLATVAVGTGLAALAANKHDAAQRPTTTGADTALDQSSAQTAATAANVCFAVGGAVAVGGVLWWILDRPSRGTTTAFVVSASPGGFSVRGLF
jgi:tetratricopeptide (TPR) repeat protein